MKPLQKYFSKVDCVDEIHSNDPSSVVNFQPVLFNQYKVQIFK